MPCKKTLSTYYYAKIMKKALRAKEISFFNSTKIPQVSLMPIKLTIADLIFAMPLRPQGHSLQVLIMGFCHFMQHSVIYMFTMVI